MTTTKQDLTKLADQALDAFWQVIVHHYPQAKTGDLSPWTTVLLQNAAENAIDEWTNSNVPHANE
jgi:hypothetical protein